MQDTMKQSGTLKSVTEMLPPKERVLRSEQIGLSSHQNEYNNGALMNNWIEERNAYDYQDKLRGDTAFLDLQKTGTTLNQTLYTNPLNIKSNAYQVVEPILPNETGKEILFVHGDDKTEKSLVSMSGLTFAGPNNSLKTDMALKGIKVIQPAVNEAHVPTRLLDQKKLQWQLEKENERDLSSTFKSTYHSEISEKQKLSETSTTSTHIPASQYSTLGSIIPDKNTLSQHQQTGGYNAQSWSEQQGKSRETLQHSTPQPRPTNSWGSFTKSLTEDYRKTGLRQPIEYKNTPLSTLKH